MGASSAQAGQTPQEQAEAGDAKQEETAEAEGKKGEEEFAEAVQPGAGQQAEAGDAKAGEQAKKEGAVREDVVQGDGKDRDKSVGDLMNILQNLTPDDQNICSTIDTLLQHKISDPEVLDMAFSQQAACVVYVLSLLGMPGI